MYERMEQKECSMDGFVCRLLCCCNSNCMCAWCDSSGNVIATVIMSFSSFGYYGQIWFNRDYTYECAIEEMPTGYADGLMAASPVWALVVVIIVGVALSVLISNLTSKLFKLDRE